MTRLKSEHAAALREAGGHLARLERRCEDVVAAAEAEAAQTRDEHAVETGTFRAVIVDLEARLSDARAAGKRDVATRRDASSSTTRAPATTCVPTTPAAGAAGADMLDRLAHDLERVSGRVAELQAERDRRGERERERKREREGVIVEPSLATAAATCLTRSHAIVLQPL